MSKMLLGVRILDLTRLLPGAICTMILADMGADVIKIEDPGAGDYARWVPPLINGLGAFFRATNRGKRSLILNLKHPEGLQTFQTLVEQADVVIEGFRPGVTRRLGVDYGALKAINPRLIYCSLSGWGQDGPYAQVSAHDLNYVALNGILGSMGTPQVPGAQVADVGGAYGAAMGIAAALFQRERTGKGEYLDISLAEAAMPFAMYQFVEAVTAGMAGGAGTLTGGSAYYNIYWSSDDQPMSFAPIETKFWENFCHLVDHPEWIPDQTIPEKQEELQQKLTQLFCTKTAAEWDAILGQADCCFTLVTDPGALVADAHVQARQSAGISPDGVPWMRSPVRVQHEEIEIHPAPAFGEHTRSILKEIGLTENAIQDLYQAGAIGNKPFREQ